MASCYTFKITEITNRKVPKISIYTVGKTKEVWLQQALSEYEKRLPFSIDWHISKTLTLPPTYVALDPTGTPHTSESFASWFYAISPRAFVIGTADGLTPTEKAQATHLISLSPLTFTHQMTRLILLEQIYRATQIYKGSSYHK